jgi:hypothetical protein
MMSGMDRCEFCELPRESCPHGLRDRQASAVGSVQLLLVSPKSVAHFPGCPHKGDDLDYSNWAELRTDNAWQRLGNGESLEVAGGARAGRVASWRCSDCVDHGPW